MIIICLIYCSFFYHIRHDRAAPLPEVTFSFVKIQCKLLLITFHRDYCRVKEKQKRIYMLTGKKYIASLIHEYLFKGWRFQKYIFRSVQNTLRLFALVQLVLKHKSVLTTAFLSCERSITTETIH